MAETTVKQRAFAFIVFHFQSIGLSCFVFVGAIFSHAMECSGIVREGTSVCRFKSVPTSVIADRLAMLCTAQLPGPVLKAFGWVQIYPFQMADKSPMITDQLTAGGSVSQLSQLVKLWP